MVLPAQEDWVSHGDLAPLALTLVVGAGASREAATIYLEVLKTIDKWRDNPLDRDSYFGKGG